MYIVRDPLTPDTIVGVVIGMAQGARIIPDDRPVIGVCPNPSGDSPMLKVSGRAQKTVVQQGVNLMEAFSRSAEMLNGTHGQMLAEGGGHPMAAGAFVHHDYLDEYLELVSKKIVSMMSEKQ
jgi:RecJ-like exonuclease